MAQNNISKLFTPSGARNGSFSSVGDFNEYLRSVEAARKRTLLDELRARYGNVDNQDELDHNGAGTPMADASAARTQASPAQAAPAAPERPASNMPDTLQEVEERMKQRENAAAEESSRRQRQMPSWMRFMSGMHSPTAGIAGGSPGSADYDHQKNNILAEDEEYQALRRRRNEIAQAEGQRRLQEAEGRRERIAGAKEELSQELDRQLSEGESRPWKAIAAKAAFGASTGLVGAAAALLTSRYALDPEYKTLHTAERDANKEVQTARNMRDFARMEEEGGAANRFKEFGRGVTDTLGSDSFWTWGLTDLDAALAKNGVKERAEAGAPLSAADYMLMEASYNNDQTQSVAEAVTPSFYDFGVIGTESLPFMVEFLATGGIANFMQMGAKAGIRLATRGLSQAAIRSAARDALSTAARNGIKLTNREAVAAGLKNLASRSLGSKAVYYTGTALTDFGIGLGYANTTGAARTGADILNRHMGSVQRLDDGSYAFGHFEPTLDEAGNPVSDSEGNPVAHFVQGGDSWGKAIWKAELANALEYYTEMLGVHMSSGVINSAIGRGINKVARSGAMQGTGQAARTARVGMKQLGRWFEQRAVRGEFGTVGKVDKFFDSVGINGYFGEVLEEEANIVLNSLLVGDNKFSDLWDRKTQIDIWGGMAFSIGGMKAMGYAAAGTYNGYRAMQFKKAESNLSDMEVIARGRLTEERWAPIRERIDQTENDGMVQVVEDILNDPTLHENEKRAVLNYIGASMEFRGFNQGTMVESNSEGIAAMGVRSKQRQLAHNQQVENSFRQGYDGAMAPGFVTRRAKRASGQQDLTAALEEYENWLQGKTAAERLEQMRQEGASEQEISLAFERAKALAAYQGMRQRMEDNVHTGEVQAREEIRSAANERGGHQRAVLSDGTNVFILSGNVAMKDGAVDRRASDDAIFVYDPQTHNRYSVAPSELAQVETERSAEEVESDIQEALAISRQQLEADLDGAVRPQVGQEMTVGVNADGSFATARVELVDGDNVYLSGADGSIRTETTASLQAASDARADIEFEQQYAELMAQSREEEAPAEASRGYQPNDKIDFTLPDGTKVRGLISEVFDDGSIEVGWFDRNGKVKLQVYPNREALDAVVTSHQSAVPQQAQEQTPPPPPAIQTANVAAPVQTREPAPSMESANASEAASQVDAPPSVPLTAEQTYEGMRRSKGATPASVKQNIQRQLRAAHLRLQSAQSQELTDEQLVNMSEAEIDTWNQSYNSNVAEAQAAVDKWTAIDEMHEQATQAREQEESVEPRLALPENDGVQSQEGKVHSAAQMSVIEAFNSLLNKKGGRAKGLFTREGLGKIDLLWGNEKEGLKHLILRHIVQQSDFGSLEELANSLVDIIQNGEMVEHEGDILFLKDGYKAVVIKSADGNFVLTAYDQTRPKSEKKRSEADATRLYQSIFGTEDGNLVPQSSASGDKVNTSSAKKQEPGEKSSEAPSEKAGASQSQNAPRGKRAGLVPTQGLNKREAAVLDAVAKRLGVTIEFVPASEIGGNNGCYMAGTNTIYLSNRLKTNADGKSRRALNEAIMKAMGHEVGHAIRRASRANPALWARYRQAVKDAMGEEAFEAEVARIKALYDKAYDKMRRENPAKYGNLKNLSIDEVEEEVAVEAGGELIAKNPSILNDLINAVEEPAGLVKQILEAVKEAIKKLRAVLTGHAGELRALERMQRQWEEMFRYAAEVERQHKIYDSEGNPVDTEAVDRITENLGDSTDMPGGGTRSTKFSITAMAEGTGFEALEDDGKGNVAFVGSDGTVYNADNPITAERLRKDKGSTFGLMTNDALRFGFIDEAQMGKMYDRMAVMLNAYLERGSAKNGGYDNLAGTWQWIGETIYKAVALNSDSQYGWSLDITRVCKKNEAIICAISEMQRRLGYGITPTQIMDLYLKTVEEGYQVPCAVCYVFTRYIRNGKYATIMLNGQRKYGDKLRDTSKMSAKEKAEYVAHWRAELAKQKAIEDAMQKDVGTANEELTHVLQDIDKLSFSLIGKPSAKDIAAVRAKMEILDARWRAALNVVSQSSLSSWITQYAIKEVKKDGKTSWVPWEDSSRPIPEEIILDLRETATAMAEYPAVQRFRKSRGAAAGKEIHFVANNDIGDVPMMLGSQSATKDMAMPRSMTAEEWEELKSQPNGELKRGVVNDYKLAAQARTAKERNAYLKKARTRLKAAHVYALQQTLRGGQRMWSWSDNIERLAPDVALNLLQLEMLGGGLQSYSKQLEGIKHVASLQGYVNGSLIGKGIGYREVPANEVEQSKGKFYLKGEGYLVMDKKGNLTKARHQVYFDKKTGKYYALEFDEVMGIQAYGHYDENGVYKKGLFDLNRQLDKAGNILVGMNDIHVRAAMASDDIMFIIPWHASGANNHILQQMFNVLGVSYDPELAQDFTKVQEEKMIDDEHPVSDYLRALWEDHYSNAREIPGYGMVRGADFACGIEGGIESGNGAELSEGQKHYRELRDAIFKGIKVPTGQIDKKTGKPKYKTRTVEEERPDWLREIQNDAFLSQVLRQVRNVVGKDGFMTSGDCKYIYPYEYWDETSTFDTADINGVRYLEYCRRLGVKPKFSGKLDGNQEKDFGNFVDDRGFWKVLIDRRMYDTEGRFQPLRPVDVAGFTMELVDPLQTEREFEVTRVANEEAAAKIVDKTMEMESARINGIAQVDYDMTLESAVEEYRKARALEAPKFSVSENNDIRFRVREGAAPSKTKRVYKLMRLGTDGKLYPLFVDAAAPTELGVWYDADSPNLDMLRGREPGIYLVNGLTGEVVSREDFNREHPDMATTTKYPSKDAINFATNNNLRWVYIEETGKAQKRFGGESRKYWNLGINGSGTVSTFSMRPGWHAASLPTMRQIGKGKNKDLRDDSFVWVEGEVSADVDYNEEASRNPDKDLPDRIPTDGYYMKATNADAAKSQADRVGWYVAGAFKANRIISDAEARRVIDEYNAAHPDAAPVEYDYARESGKDFTPQNELEEQQRINEANERFNAELMRWEKGKLNADDVINIGSPCGILRQFLPGYPLMVKQSVLTKARKKHSLSASDMLNLPKAISEPIFIFKSSPTKLSVLTELKTKDGKNLFVAISIEENRQLGNSFVNVNELLTIHGREAENIILPIIENGSLVWRDAKKGLQWLSSAKTNSQAITKEVLDSAAKIVKEFVNPTMPSGKSSGFIQQSFQ